MLDIYLMQIKWNKLLRGITMKCNNFYDCSYSAGRDAYLVCSIGEHKIYCCSSCGHLYINLDDTQQKYHEENAKSLNVSESQLEKSIKTSSTNKKEYKQVMTEEKEYMCECGHFYQDHHKQGCTVKTYSYLTEKDEFFDIQCDCSITFNQLIQKEIKTERERIFYHCPTYVKVGIFCSDKRPNFLCLLCRVSAEIEIQENEKYLTKKELETEKNKEAMK